VHLETFPELPAEWLDPALAERWTRLRDLRTAITGAVETERREKRIGSSLEARVGLPHTVPETGLLDEPGWAELAIVSQVRIEDGQGRVTAGSAGGTKCVRCWRVLPEVGSTANHPSLCLRCADAVESGRVCTAA
jgi:isoleucyl-tRNA synthetase